MKMPRCKLFLCLLVVISLGSTSALATTDRASERITQYFIVPVSQVNNTHKMQCSVRTNAIMQRIGIYSIDIDLKDGDNWIDSTDYDINDNNMFSYDTLKYSKFITIKGNPGDQYRINVVFFAEDSTGTDYRSSEAYITI